MRKERNCGMPYPVYQNGMMPIMPINMAPNMNPMNPNMQYYTSSNSIEQKITSMEEAINNLDKRVSKLEMTNKATTEYNTKYSDSNYYML